MAETYDLAPDDAARGMAELRAELAAQVEEEGRALLRKRDLAALEERRQRIEEARLRHLKEEAGALDRLAAGFRTAQGALQGFAGIFQQFARGDLFGGVLGAFGAGARQLSGLGSRWQGQADDAAKAKHEEAYAARLKQHRKDVKAGLADKDDKPVKEEAPKGVSVAASALGALGAAGSLVVQAFGALSGAAQTLWGTMTGFARSVPGVGNALSSVFNLISAKVTQALLPKIIDVAAWLVTFSDVIAQVVSDILLACASFVEWMAKAAMKSADPTGGILGDAYAKQDEQTKRNIRIGFSKDGTDPLEKQQAEEKRRRASLEDNKASIWKTIMAGSYQPQIEQQGDQAWRRIQMGELGTNDIDRQTLDVLLKIYQMGEQFFQSQKAGKAGDAGGFAKFLGGALGFR